jgi:hypothetical protein
VEACCLRKRWRPSRSTPPPSDTPVESDTEADVVDPSTLMSSAVITLWESAPSRVPFVLSDVLTVRAGGRGG